MGIASDVVTAGSGLDADAVAVDDACADVAVASRKAAVPDEVVGADVIAVDAAMADCDQFESATSASSSAAAAAEPATVVGVANVAVAATAVVVATSFVE